MSPYEIIGIAASIALITSVCFKSTSVKLNILMRILNSVGAILFVIYGCLLTAWSTAASNLIICIINIINIIVLIKDKNKE